MDSRFRGSDEEGMLLGPVSFPRKRESTLVAIYGQPNWSARSVKLSAT